MSKKRRNTKDALKKSKLYSDILLFEATGGTMGTPLADGAKVSSEMTFAEKRGLLDSMIKIAGLDHKVNPEDDDSVFDTIRKSRINGSKISGSEDDSGHSEGTVLGESADH